MNYWLKLYDDNLLKFTMDNQVGEGFRATALEADRNRCHLFPVEYALSQFRDDFYDNRLTQMARSAHHPQEP